MGVHSLRWTQWALAAAVLIPLSTLAGAQTVGTNLDQAYEHKETRDLVALVRDAGDLVRTKGEEVFGTFRMSGSRWRQDEAYVFVLDLDGNMLVHPDPAMEGKNESGLKDIDGKPIIRGLIDAATTPETFFRPGSRPS